VNKNAEAELVAGLTEREQAALPSRLRALVADEHVRAWNEAKATRDAAIDAAEAAAEAAIDAANALIEEYEAELAASIEPGAPDYGPVLTSPPPVDSVGIGQVRVAAIEAAKEQWAKRKAELLAEQEG